MQAKQLRDLFRAKLKSRRLEVGMSQTVLAKRIRAQQPYIAALEAGDMNPTLTTIAKLGEALGVEPSFFFATEILSETA